MPQHRFASIHVVGTNGKTSVSRMTGALLEAQGCGAGADLSPHIGSWSERGAGPRRGDRGGGFGGARSIALRDAAEGVNRTLEEGEAVTQFEAATAATFLALAEAGVKPAAIEAGLGGRLDATNTIPSRVTVLTSIGLDHTEWLGETELEIAAEKLAVLRDADDAGARPGLAEVGELAERTAAERGARLVRAPEDPGAGGRAARPGAFQRRNFALAMRRRRGLPRRASTRTGRRRRRRRSRSRAARADRRAPADLRRRRPQPRRRRGAGRGAARDRRGRPVVACLAILADKDAAAMVAALAPGARRASSAPSSPADGLRAHGRPGARSRPAAELAAALRGGRVCGRGRAGPRRRPARGPRARRGAAAGSCSSPVRIT